MKKLVLVWVSVFGLASCTKDADTITPANEILVTNYDYSTEETELIRIINEYRVDHELNELEVIDHISYKCKEHNNYMIARSALSHDNFSQRVDNFTRLLGATLVGENLAFNLSSPNAALAAWLNNPTHRHNIEGNFTHMGIAITPDPEGRKYYTNIFIRK